MSVLNKNPATIDRDASSPPVPHPGVERRTRRAEGSIPAAPSRPAPPRGVGRRTRRSGSLIPQRGGFGVGLIVGLLIGLALALGVALYVTKVPIPFVNKVPLRSPAQDAAEAEKNRNWDPNSPLYGKNPARPASIASGVVEPTAPGALPSTPPVATTPPPSSTTAPSVATPPVARASAPARDPAAILADRAPTPRVASTGDAPANDPFTYFVQAGAFGTPEDAEQQRARLAMLGVEAKLSEREQAGRTVHRVRLGPFDKKSDADAAKERLNGAGIEAALVRVQR